MSNNSTCKKCGHVNSVSGLGYCVASVGFGCVPCGCKCEFPLSEVVNPKHISVGEYTVRAHFVVMEGITLSRLHQGLATAIDDSIAKAVANERDRIRTAIVKSHWHFDCSEERDEVLGLLDLPLCNCLAVGNREVNWTDHHSDCLVFITTDAAIRKQKGASNE